MVTNNSSSDRDLFDQIKNNLKTGNYQEVYDRIQQLRSKKLFESLSAEHQVLYLSYEAECLYFAGKIKQAEQLARKARKIPALQTSKINQLALAELTLFI